MIILKFMTVWEGLGAGKEGMTEDEMAGYKQYYCTQLTDEKSGFKWSSNLPRVTQLGRGRTLS